MADAKSTKWKVSYTYVVADDDGGTDVWEAQMEGLPAEDDDIESGDWGMLEDAHLPMILADIEKNLSKTKDADLSVFSTAIREGGDGMASEDLAESDTWDWLVAKVPSGEYAGGLAFREMSSFIGWGAFAVPTLPHEGICFEGNIIATDFPKGIHPRVG